MKKYIFALVALLGVTLTSVMAVDALDLKNKEFFFLPVIPPIVDMADKVKTEDGHIVEAPSREDLQSLDVTYDERLLVRYVYEALTGQVIFISVFDHDQVIYANNFDHNLNYIDSKDALPFARFVDIDINANGRKDVLFESYTGGAHCCTTTLFFEYDEQGVLGFKGKMPSMHQSLKFTNLDSDSAMEIELVDWTFSYWQAPYSSSAKPRVVLDYDESLDRYKVAENLMIIEQDQDVLRGRANAIKADEKAWKREKIPYLLIKTVVEDFIYIGAGLKSLETFLEAAWPDAYKERQKLFLEDLQAHLKKSPWWSTIAAMNNFDLDFPLVEQEIVEEIIDEPIEESVLEEIPVEPVEKHIEEMQPDNTEVQQDKNALAVEPISAEEIETDDAWVEKNFKDQNSVKMYFEF